MRSYGCDHCGHVEDVRWMANRRPQGWASVRVNIASKPYDTAATTQAELCPQCVIELRKFLQMEDPTT